MKNCPNCNKPGGATMLSSSWGHRLMCCSESCGLDVRDKIAANEQTEAFMIADSELSEARVKVEELRFKGINGVDYAHTSEYYRD